MWKVRVYGHQDLPCTGGAGRWQNRQQLCSQPREGMCLSGNSCGTAFPCPDPSRQPVKVTAPGSHLPGLARVVTTPPGEQGPRRTSFQSRGQQAARLGGAPGCCLHIPFLCSGKTAAALGALGSSVPLKNGPIPHSCSIPTVYWRPSLSLGPQPWLAQNQALKCAWTPSP